VDGVRVHAGVEERSPPPGQRSSERRVAGREPGAEVDPRVCPPDQARDEGGGERPSVAWVAPADELPGRNRERDDEELLFRQREERKAQEGDSASATHIGGEAAQEGC